MNPRLLEQSVIVGAVGYLAALSLAITRLSYDIWGALVITPPLAVIGVVGIHRMFDGELRPLRRWLLIALALKLAGAAARYWVAFDVYGGSADAQRYHSAGADAARRVWSGEASLFSVLPSGTGTTFLEKLTAFVYTIAGTSKLAGFVIFSWLAFWGTAYFIKAACVGVPGLAQRRYAAGCAIAPSLAYWPSSIGKEAPMMLCLGVASYGIARLVTRHRPVGGVVLIILGLGGSAFIRPHMAGIWLGGLVIALLVTVVAGSRRRGVRHVDGGSRVVLVLVASIAAVALWVVGNTALRYLTPKDDLDGNPDSLTQILEETRRRTSEAGSSFIPPSVDRITDWPFAVVRTLSRPMIFEARGASQLFSALEMTVYVVAFALTFRGLRRLPSLVMRTPYATFSVVTLFAAGLAYTNLANLGVLTRQKSLLLPLMLLMLCLPTKLERETRVEADGVMMDAAVPLSAFAGARDGPDESRA